MPMLLRELAVAGSRKADGTPNASGYVFLYQPGTTSTMTAWRDEAMSQAWATVAGGVPLDAAGRAVIWVSGQVDVVVQDAAGATLQTLPGYTDAPAAAITVQNAGFTGTITDQSTGNATLGAGGVTTLDSVLSAAQTSFGGIDFKFLESAGGASLPYAGVIRAIQITPQMFNAKGNGLDDDTSAVQAALNRVVALGGGIVFFPPGTYKISSGLTLPQNVTGVVLRGSGRASTISLTAGTVALTVGSSSAYTAVENLQVSGGDLQWTNATAPLVQRVLLNGGTNGVQFLGSGFGGTTTNGTVRSSVIGGTTCALQASNGTGTTVVDSTLAATTSAVLLSSGGSFFASNVSFQATAGIAWASGASASAVVIGSPSMRSTVTTPFDTSLLTTDPGIVQFGNQIDSKTLTTPADGTTQAHPDTTYLSNVVRVSSGAGTAILGTPLLTPTSFQDGKEFVVVFWNNSGSDVVWSLNAVWHVATTISGTNGNRTSVRFRWDQAATCWREMARAVTT